MSTPNPNETPSQAPEKVRRTATLRVRTDVRAGGVGDWDSADPGGP